MDIKVYTDMLESHLHQLLNILQPTAKCSGEIHCVCVCRPQDSFGTPNPRKMWVEWTIRGLKPSQGKPSYEWASEVHKGLRKFPCLSDLTIKYETPRANWGQSHYHWGGHNYSTGFDHSWDHLEANGGLTAYGQANIPMPAEASDHVTVRLEWEFVPQGL